MLLLLACTADDPKDALPDETGGDSSSDTEGGPDTDTAPPDPVGDRLYINELLPRNETGLEDATGAFPDWVELYNAGDDVVDLGGWSLSDAPKSTGWVLPAGLVVPPRGHLLLVADGDPKVGPDHLPFSLDADSEELVLYDPKGVAVSSVAWGNQAPDLALARVGDGAASWTITTPTPGASNGPADPAPVPSVTPATADCDPALDAVPPYYLEGDTISAVITCQDTWADPTATLGPLALPAGAAFDGRSFSWTTGPADGGRIELDLVVQAPGATPSVESAVLWVADNPDSRDNVPVNASYTEEWGLPVLHVDPQGSLSGDYVDATVDWYGERYPASIKIRGASSSYYPKPGYTLEFNKAELPIDDWQVNRDHLVLCSPFDDNSYVRQKLVYDQWAEIAGFWRVRRFTPRTFFVVLYLDGAYWGLFTAIDRIDNEFVADMGFNRDMNVYKAVNHDANFYTTNASGRRKSTWHDGYTKEEGTPEDNFDDLDALVEFTAGADAETLVAEAPAWFDLEEFMDWYLLVHYTNAEDSGGKNAYLFHDPAGGQFRYAPWDFNHAWGQGWYTYRIAADYVNNFQGANRIFWAVQTSTANEALLERFDAMRKDGPFSLDWQLAQLDAYYALIDRSAARDWARWGDDYRAYGWYGSRTHDWQDYEGEKAYLYAWVEDRAAVFDALYP